MTFDRSAASGSLLRRLTGRRIQFDVVDQAHFAKPDGNEGT
jgi:hypothetical protein